MNMCDCNAENHAVANSILLLLYCTKVNPLVGVTFFKRFYSYLRFSFGYPVMFQLCLLCLLCLCVCTTVNPLVIFRGSDLMTAAQVASCHCILIAYSVFRALNKLTCTDVESAAPAKLRRHQKNDKYSAQLPSIRLLQFQMISLHILNL